MAARDREPSRPADDDPTEVRLSLDWELWAVQNLVDGASPADVIDALIDEGVPETVARATIEAMRAHPGLGRVHRQLARAHLLEEGARVRRRLRVHPGVVEEVAALDAHSFFRDYWEPSRPVLITEQLAAMKAVERWSHDSLAQRFFDVPVEVNVRRGDARRRSHTERETETVPLGTFLTEAATSAGNDRYIVSRNGLLQNPALRELTADLSPAPPYLDANPFPRGVSLWAGPAGTFSAPHFDPHNSLLLQVTGTKDIRLAPPELLALLDGMDGFYAGAGFDDARLTSHPDFDPRLVSSVTVSPGQALFIPVGWFHEVRARAPSLTLTFLSFQRENHFHELRPR